MFKSRMGVLLGSGFSNITIGENNYNLANLPYPPTFVYYVGIADSAYQSPQSVSGTYSDSSTYSPEYTNKIDIEAPKDIVIDYNGILKPTGTTYTVPVGTASEDIQKMIDSMKDGDTLSFEKNGIYEKFGLQGDKSRFDKVKKIKSQYPHVKILLSFTNSVSNTDNSQDGGFSALAKSPEMRKQFAQDCRAFVSSEGIDGIDIDWEFPGMTFSSNAYDELVDVENFTLLMKDLRAELGQSTLLTYAGYCMDKRPQGEGYKYIDVKAVDPYVDFVNIMAYDLVDAPQHQSALNKPSNYWDCQRSVDEYLNAGVSADKLVLGIPFYGRADFNAGGSINYRDILNLSKDDGYVIENWDTEGNVPYVTKNGSFYCGYDNPRSIAAKGEWILKNGMKGMMFWDYEGDDTMGTLRKALWNAVMKK